MTQFQLIMLALSGLESAIQLVNGLMSAARQTAELTDKQEAELREKQKAIMSQAHWQVQPDPNK